MRLKNTCQQVIQRLENIQLTFYSGFATLLSIIFVRNFLEIFSDSNKYWNLLNFEKFFLHYPVWSIALLFLIIFALHVLSSEKIEKITKITVLFSVIIWSVPILDLILSQGRGFNISYLHGDFNSLVKQFITYFGPYSGKGASYGMRIEIGTVLFLTFLYIFYKKGSILKAIITPFIIYSIIFILGSFPAWIKIILQLSYNSDAASRFLEIEKILNHFYSFDIKISMFLLIIVLIFLFIWLYLYDKNVFKGILKNVRFARVLHYEAMLITGIVLGYFTFNNSNIFTSPLSYLVLLCAVLSVFCAWLCAIGINDFADVRIDAISNRERPLVNQKIKKSDYKNIILIFFLLALLFSYLVRYSFMIMIFVYIILAYIYSAKPLRLRQIPVLSSFIIASASLIIIMGGFLILTQNNSLSQFPGKVILLVLLVYTLAVNFKDIKDIEGDKKCGIVTIPTLMGEKNGKRVIGILVFISYILVPLILDIPGLIIFTVIYGLTSFWVLNAKKMKEFLFFTIYFIFLIQLFYFYNY
jgi:4-hydroxybenzoate polyprenyltransferase